VDLESEYQKDGNCLAKIQKRTIQSVQSNNEKYAYEIYVKMHFKYFVKIKIAKIRRKT
jgi:hypothetical protein